MIEKISIIMGVYNCENTLKESIDSIINQTYKNWELIICDDASNDNTYNIANKYKEKYPDKIILLKNENNMKLSATLNKCLSVAGGDYIARMDGDDISCANRLEKQMNFLKFNSEYDLVGTCMIPFDENGERSIRIFNEFPNKSTFLTKSPFAHATILAKREVYDKLGGYTVSNRTRRGQDADLWIRFFENKFNGYNLQEGLYKVRESIDDLNRREFKYRVDAVKTRVYGIKVLKLPYRYYILAFKPLLAGIIPKKIMFIYGKMRDKRR